MKKVLSLLIATFFLVGIVGAQNTFQPKQFDNDREGIIYNKELAIDLRIHTNGFALAANFGRLKSYYKTRYYHFEIGEVKHQKEHRQSFDPSGGFSGKTSRSFMFGKRNTLYVLRAGIGEKRYFSEKAKHKGLAIGVTYEIGPALGMLKPYYLEIINESSSSGFFLVSEKYTEENASTFLDVTRIYGASGFTKGFGELKFVPGIQFKASIHFDWGAFDEFIKAMEAGIMGDIFIKKMPLMADVEFAENRPYFINLFLTLQLGKRW